MDTLRDRLSELANDAPTGGIPAAELWARGKRTQRVRATVLAVAALVVGVFGTGVGLGLAHDGHDDPDLVPARTVGFTLPIEYPRGAALPDLGDTPGPLAAVWLVPREGGGSPEVVGLVAKTGRFGTLPIDLPPDDPEASEDVRVVLSLSPDGRRLAYPSATVPRSDDGAPDPVVRDVVTGETFTSAFGFKTRVTVLWADATHLFGYVAAGSDADGWLWEPGHAPTRVNPYDLPYAGSSVSVASWPALSPPMGQEGGSGTCTTLNVNDVRTPQSPQAKVPSLCTVLGVIGSDILVGHQNNPTDGDGTVIALQFDAADPFCPSVARRCELSVDDATRRVVATAGAPERVTFATDLIRVALGAMGGRS